jgi:predicted lipid-binding transport protein (Tim44 family)
MRIAKPILLVTTPVGLAWGLYEAHQLAGGLVFLMAALIGVITVAMISVVLTIRRERREEEQRNQQGAPPQVSDESGTDPEKSAAERLR